MPDYTDNSLRAAIKSLDDVVAPAVDPSNPLAVEQLRLVSQLLRFLLERRQALPSYEAAELSWYIDLLDALSDPLPQPESDLREAVRTSTEKARALLATPDLSSLGSMTSALATLASRVVHAGAGADEATRRRLERIVIERSGVFLDLKRAWFMPLGFEAAPDQRPCLDDLLARSAPASGHASGGDVRAAHG